MARRNIPSKSMIRLKLIDFYRANIKNDIINLQNTKACCSFHFLAPSLPCSTPFRLFISIYVGISAAPHPTLLLFCRFYRVSGTMVMSASCIFRLLLSSYCIFGPVHDSCGSLLSFWLCCFHC